MPKNTVINVKYNIKFYFEVKIDSHLRRQRFFFLILGDFFQSIHPFHELIITIKQHVNIDLAEQLTE